MYSVFGKFKYMIAALGLAGVMAIPVDVENGVTIALWDFNEASGPVVADKVLTDPVNGVASPNTQIVTTNQLGVGFGNARNFSVEESYVDLGAIANTKLELSGKNEVFLEAMIYITGFANPIMTIFDSRQIQLQIVGNKLAAFVRQSSGFKGIVSSYVLQANTPYRVALALRNGQLSVVVDGLIVGVVNISESIASAEFGASAFIGGLPTGYNLIGVVDDVRLSNTSNLDMTPPEISLISPDFSAPTVDGHPHLLFEITDNLDQLDETSIVVKLNGEIVSGLVFDAQTGTLSGQLSKQFISGRMNKIEVFAKDLVGNIGAAEYDVQFIKWGSGQEYEPDQDTLALWHLNEYGNNIIKDSSFYARHGSAGNTQTASGFFGMGRSFGGQGQSNNQIVFPPVPVEGNVFTFEAWVSISNFNYDNVIFKNGQFEIHQNSDGSVKVILISNYFGRKEYTSSIDVLGLNEFSHIKVVYDGNLKNKNLIILKNGIVISVFDAVYDCDFPNTPILTELGSSFFSGTIDEVRISKVVRESVNLIRGVKPNIEVGYPVNLETVYSEKLGLFIKYQDIEGVSPSNVKVFLNGVLQSNSAMIVTNTELKGVLPTSLRPGVNEVTIKVKGDSGNETTHQSRVFYFIDTGLNQYVTDNQTHALYDFNAPEVTNYFPDKSGNGNHLNLRYESNSVESAVFGNAHYLQSNESLSFSKFQGKSFAIDGRFRLSSVNSNSILSMTAQSLSLHLSATLNSLSVSLSLPGGASFSNTVYGIEIDRNKYHHIAMVLDSEANSANFMLLFDGKVVFQKDLKLTCNSCINDPLLYLSPYLYMDELRISNSARKSFNFGNSRGPSIGHLKLHPSQTVYTSQPNIDVLFMDESSIEQNSMTVFVNGVEDNTLQKFVSGVSGNISGQLGVGLNLGANLITVKARNQLNAESVKSYYVYYINQRSSVPYSSSGSTLGLWHFDAGQTNGPGEDFSSRGFNWNISSPTYAPGVFLEGIDFSSGYPSANASATGPHRSWTLELWAKASQGGSFNLSFDYYGQLGLNSDGSISYTRNSIPTEPNLFPIDGKYHHIVLINDELNPYQNELLLLDGVVVSARRNTSLNEMSFSYGSSSFNNVSIDEMRLSSAAIYNLTFKEVESSLLNNTKKYFHLIKR